MTQSTKFALMTIAGVVMAGALLLFGLVGLVVAANAVQPQNQIAQRHNLLQQESDDQYPSQANESLDNLLGNG